MNPFMLGGGALMTAAALWALTHGDRRMAGVYLCYATANFILSTIKG